MESLRFCSQLEKVGENDQVRLHDMPVCFQDLLPGVQQKIQLDWGLYVFGAPIMVNPTLTRQIFQPPQSIGKNTRNPGILESESQANPPFRKFGGSPGFQYCRDAQRFFRIPGFKLSAPKASPLHSKPGHLLQPWPASKRQTFACQVQGCGWSQS